MALRYRGRPPQRVSEPRLSHDGYGAPDHNKGEQLLMYNTHPNQLAPCLIHLQRLNPNGLCLLTAVHVFEQSGDARTSRVCIKEGSILICIIILL